MPKKCFVPGCSTGYDSNRAAEAELAARRDPISIFLFPKDDTIRKQWLQNISRDAEDKPQAKRYVCSLHFKNTDYETSKVCRGTERQVRSLKKGAVPTVFNNASYPSYMKDTSVKNRTTTMSSSVARREGEWTEHEQETEAWLASDRFNSLEDLKDKVAKDLLPDFRLSLDKDELGERQYLTIFTYKPQQDLMPAMDNILRITDDGTFVMYKHGARISKSKLRNIIRDHKDRFTMVSQVTNAVAFLKNYQVEDSDQIKKIEEALEDLDLENISMEHQQLFSLIKMQVSLCQKPKNNRKYTSEFLIKCAILYRSSPKMYRLMRKEMGLIVPDESTVQRVTRVAAYKGGIDAETRATFQAFAEKLPEREKVLHLGIDEVHTLNTLQLFGGDLRGLTKDGEVASVLLSVHANAVFGSFSEMVSMTPKVSSKTDDIREELDAAIQILTEVGFRVHSISFDGHATNAGYYSSLRMGDKWSFQNPYNEEQQIFVYFDPVHLWKNIYNSFQKKMSIQMPRCPGTEEPERPRSAKFSHLRTLAKWEQYSPVKAAYKLTEKVLSPSSIEKQSVGLIMSVIHPYTVAGLRLYARVKNCEQFCETADVLEAWQRLVAVMNVRGPGQDRRWHDRYRCVLRPGVQPGTFDDQSEANLEFLLQMSDIFKGMAEDGNHGRGHKVNRLATPTASALHITCNALVASCRDLLNLNIEGVEYVAMGKANSDPTEHSFGKRRVMCGTNYWTSVQAFMVSNRLSQKLHLINLVGFLPQHIQEDLQLAKDKEKEEDTAILTELAEELMEEDRNPPTDPLVVASIGNYAGYLAKKVQSKGSVASCCKEELCEEQGDITVENSGTEATDKFTALTDLVDRRSIQDGSNVLQRPALPMAHMASFGMMVWDSLMCCEENRERRVKFLSLTMQHADAFGYLIGVLAEAESALKEYRCQEGHLLVRTVLPHIARSLFNGFGSNLAKDVTSEARKNKLSVPGGRRREHDGDDGGSSKSVMDRETYKRSKVTSAYKS